MFQVHLDLIIARGRPRVSSARGCIVKHRRNIKYTSYSYNYFVASLYYFFANDSSWTYLCSNV